MVTKGWRASRSQVVASSSVVVIKSMPGLHSGLKMAAPRLISRDSPAAHRRHEDKRPGRREGAHGNVDQRRPVAAAECPSQPGTKFLRRAGPFAGGAKA